MDIDNGLVQDAWRHRQAVWSAQAPPESTQRHNAEGEQSPETDVNEGQRIDLQNARYFPASLYHSFGPVAIPTTMSQTTFPRNVTFRTANWVDDGIQEDESGYDVIVA